MVRYAIAEITKNGKPLGRLFERVLFLSEYFDTENNIMLHIISQGFFNFQCANQIWTFFWGQNWKYVPRLSHVNT